ncbi:MAG: DASH family cryptochrome [Saprospiraceae bacterium]|nr:DASH family cryptochrome [Saprospiraceae bacterium]
MERRSIVWFRSDLRLHDNQALVEAVHSSDCIVAVYVFDTRVFEGTTSYGFKKTGVHRARFIKEAVRALREDLRERGGELIVRVGHPEVEIYELARKLRTSWVFCNRERTSEEVFVQDQLEKKLWSIGQEIRFERGKMLLYTQDLPFPITHAPDQFATFKKETEHFVRIRSPFAIPQIKTLDCDVECGDLPMLSDFGHDNFGLSEDSEFVRGGEQIGMERMKNYFINYVESAGGESHMHTHLSPWVSQGCLSPKSIYHHMMINSNDEFFNSTSPVVQSLLWRDYYRLMGKKYKELVFFKDGPQQMKMMGLNDRIDRASNWLEGKTGVPIIDACMSQLRLTGYLEHKGRVLLANFLVREMEVNWIIGAELFESLLLDYDPCSNYGNWNHVAGVGVDTTHEKVISFAHQEKKLDPDGSYSEKWLSLAKDLQY